MHLPDACGALAAAAALKEDVCWDVLCSMSDSELQEVSQGELAACCHGRYVTYGD